MVNMQRLTTGCFLLLVPGVAQAASNGLSVAATLLPLATILVVAMAAGWLWRQWRYCDRARRAATARSQVLRQVVDLAPWPVIVTDQDLRIIEANTVAAQRYDRDCLSGAGLLELEPSLATHPLVTALQAAETITSEVLSPVSSSESLRLITVDGQKYLLYAENALGVDQQAASTATILSQAEESANRMKSEFIANINHEVRTPMNAIIGYTEMLANADLGPKEHRFVTIIHKSSMALVSIFNDIMELSKIDSGRLQILASSIRLSSVINEVDGLFQDLAREKGILLHSHIAPSLPVTYILDGVRLKQVLQNLVSNAIKFTAEGQVDLTVAGAPSSTRSGCYDLSFTVQDTGIGIPAADQQKIFELFRQREDTIAKRYGGVGLGLTLCSRLVTMMGGRIDLFSREGKGARFTVQLRNIPLADQEEGEEIVTPREPESRKQGMTILVVDDVDLIKDVFIDFFQDSPYRVVTANNGEETLALVRQEQPGLIFMDLNLGGSNGRAVTEQLRHLPETATVPVIVMTGDMLEEEDYKPLFDDFLQKPFRLDALKEVVARYTPSAPAQAGPPETAESGDDEHALYACMAAAWNEELEQLRTQSLQSGSLADAAELARAMQQRGTQEQQPLLVALGTDLLHFAHEPNILGVDRLLARLSRGINRNAP
jgi:signal transduction histidine kinase/DNA-binding response OmpR family regulator